MYNRICITIIPNNMKPQYKPQLQFNFQHLKLYMLNHDCGLNTTM